MSTFLGYFFLFSFVSSFFYSFNLIQTPESGVRSPESRVQSPESRVQSPGSRVQSPESRVQSPESRVQGPESRVQGPESRVQGPVQGPVLVLYYAVFDAILTGRQSGQKLQCFYKNPMANNVFPKFNFTQFMNQNVKILGRRLFSPSLQDVAFL